MLVSNMRHKLHIDQFLTDVAGEAHSMWWFLVQLATRCMIHHDLTFFSLLQFCFSNKIMSTALFKVSTSCFIAVFIWITSPVSPENTSSCDAWNNQWKDNFWRYSSQSVEIISHILLTLTSHFSTTSLYLYWQCPLGSLHWSLMMRMLLLWLEPARTWQNR